MSNEPLAVSLYPHLKPYYQYEFPRHVVLALVACAMETGGAFDPLPIALAADGTWTFSVSRDLRLWSNDQEMRADPVAAGRWLARNYCTGLPDRKVGA